MQSHDACENGRLLSRRAAASALQVWSLVLGKLTIEDLKPNFSWCPADILHQRKLVSLPVGVRITASMYWTGLHYSRPGKPTM